jgi:hypothetical protein
MEQRTFEGTWEEILLHAPELAGRRIKLTVLTNEDPNHQSTNTLDKLLEGRVGRVRFQPSDLSDRTGEAFTDLLMAKYKPSGFSQ